MGRRSSGIKHPALPDAKYNSVIVTKLINRLMIDGKQNTAESVVYGAMDIMAAQEGKDAVSLVETAVKNVTPMLEVKARRVGGANYQVPVEVDPARQSALAMRWIVTFAQTRKGVSMGRALAQELMDAYKNQGNAVKKRDDTHKMAQANKAFAHYRW